MSKPNVFLPSHLSCYSAWWWHSDQGHKPASRSRQWYASWASVSLRTHAFVCSPTIQNYNHKNVIISISFGIQWTSAEQCAHAFVCKYVIRITKIVSYLYYGIQHGHLFSNVPKQLSFVALIYVIRITKQIIISILLLSSWASIL